MPMEDLLKNKVLRDLKGQEYEPSFFEPTNQDLMKVFKPTNQGIFS